MNIAVIEGKLPLLLFLCLIGSGCLQSTAYAQSGTYPHVEASFEIGKPVGNPFDYQQTDVRVMVQCPDASTISLPAFFDGGTLWRVRYTPPKSGTYRITAITLNGQPSEATHIQPNQWRVTGQPTPGFIRVDQKNPQRFAFDNGQRYFPVGQNVAWGDTAVIFPKMSAAQENWGRVWMAHWAGNNLDWVMNARNEPGQLSLDVARKWDGIVDAAEKNGIYFQMTLQHHGPYSSTTDSNWKENPWNKANGGFLTTPEEFFTSERARTLTKAKYRYIVARWGYSPAIMAWELFNEVEWTDAIKNKHEETVLAWHKEMATFIRTQDSYHHLITTSSNQRIVGLFEDMDYLQHHDYPNDLIGSARNAISAVSPLVGKKPDFGGEVGHGNTPPYSLRAVLFASLMANESGAAQPWYWDVYEKDNLYSVFTPAALFVRASKLAEQDHLSKTEPAIETDARIDLVLQPGAGWVPATQHEFVIDGNSPPVDFVRFPAYFFGTNNKGMNPGPVVFHIDFPKQEQMTVHIGEVSRSGAHLRILVDGEQKAEQDFPATPMDTRVKVALAVDIPAGKHTVTMENTGADWAHISDFTFPNAARALGAYGLTNGRWAAMWIYQRAQVLSADAPQTLSGKVSLTGLKKGKYRAVWWDTVAGKALQIVSVTIQKEEVPFSLDTPPILRDIALYVETAK